MTTEQHTPQATILIRQCARSIVSMLEASENTDFDPGVEGWIADHVGALITDMDDREHD